MNSQRAICAYAETSPVRSIGSPACSVTSRLGDDANLPDAGVLECGDESELEVQAAALAQHVFASEIVSLATIACASA